MKRPVRPQIGGTASAEADLEAALERARESYEEERAFFRRLLDATVYVHAPVSDDSKTPRLVQFRHPDGFDAIPFFLSLAKAQVASSSAVKILAVVGRDLLAGTRGATLMFNPNDGGSVLYPEEVATLLETGFLARVEKLPDLRNGCEACPQCAKLARPRDLSEPPASQFRVGGLCFGDGPISHGQTATRITHLACGRHGPR